VLAHFGKGKQGAFWFLDDGWNTITVILANATTKYPGASATSFKECFRCHGHYPHKINLPGKIAIPYVGTADK
jgi:hypothetical protein